MSDWKRTDEALPPPEIAVLCARQTVDGIWAYQVAEYDPENWAWNAYLQGDPYYLTEPLDRWPLWKPLEAPQEVTG